MADIPRGLRTKLRRRGSFDPALPPLLQEPCGVGRAVTWHRRTEAVGRAGNGDALVLQKLNLQALEEPGLAGRDQDRPRLLFRPCGPCQRPQPVCPNLADFRDTIATLITASRKTAPRIEVVATQGGGGPLLPDGLFAGDRWAPLKSPPEAGRGYWSAMQPGPGTAEAGQTAASSGCRTAQTCDLASKL